jgi:hypothetical protein
MQTMDPDVYRATYPDLRNKQEKVATGTPDIIIDPVIRKGSAIIDKPDFTPEEWKRCIELQDEAKNNSPWKWPIAVPPDQLDVFDSAQAGLKDGAVTQVLDIVDKRADERALGEIRAALPPDLQEAFDTLQGCDPEKIPEEMKPKIDMVKQIININFVHPVRALRILGPIHDAVDKEALRVVHGADPEVAKKQLIQTMVYRSLDEGLITLEECRRLGVLTAEEIQRAEPFENGQQNKN